MAPCQSMPGQITPVFLYDVPPSLHSSAAQGGSHCPGVYISVQPYGSLQPKLSDMDWMYRRFGFAGGFLC
jgi:hypothetical protein